MELLLTPEQDDKQDEQFRQIVRQRVAEADAGIFIEEEEMDARFEQMLKNKV